MAYDADSLSESIAKMKVDLAAALRLAVLHDLQEGIDNHFTAIVPGSDDRYLMLPFGQPWALARASDMIVFDEAGNTLEGEGLVEMTAQCIHAPIHRIKGARVVMHTHQPWAVALNMLEDNRLLPATQTSAQLERIIAYDNDYTGLATSLEEGERLAAALGDKTILFMKNHGVMVATNSVATAYKILYMLERVCRTQLLAMATGRPLQMISSDVVDRLQMPEENDRHRGQRHILFLDAMKRVLDREMPGYAE